MKDFLNYEPVINLHPISVIKRLTYQHAVECFDENNFVPLVTRVAFYYNILTERHELKKLFSHV